MSIPSQFRLSLTAASLALVAGLANATPTGPISADSGSTEALSPQSIQMRMKAGNRAQVLPLRVLNADRTSSKAIVDHPQGSHHAPAFLVTNQVLVRLVDAQDALALHGAVDRMSTAVPGAHVACALGEDGVTWVVKTPTVAGAAEIAEKLAALSFVKYSAVDSGPWIDPPVIDANHKLLINHQERVRAMLAPGITPVGMPGGGTPRHSRGGSDPLVGAQWWLQNTLNPGRDLNVQPVYGRGLTGAGVTVGITALLEGAIQPDHIDFGGRFDESISQPANPNAGFDDFATFYAGLIGAEAGNGIGGQGIAPGVRLASMIYGTPIREAQSYDWKYDEIDIKVHPRALSLFFSPADSYSPGMIDDYVMVSLENSLRLGRGGKGTIHVFSTGVDGTLNPPYIGSGDAWQDIFDSVGEVAVSLTNNYTTVPLYPGGQVHNYPPAGHRSTFVIAGVGEDNNTDPFSTIGAGVFASVYSSSSNEIFFGPNISRGLTSTTSGDGFETDFIDPLNDAPAAIAAGVFALMLEANPNLTVRDIQHIIADTAVTFDLGYDFFNPYVTASPSIADGGTSNWGSNGEFKIHSDQFGFGLIDADAAVAAASNWTSPGRLYVLDTGIRESGATIPDASMIEQSETQSVYMIANGAVLPFCIRENFKVEAIEVELTIAGDGGSNDLMIHLESPYGTTSNLHYPVSVNPTGTTFDPPNNDNLVDTQTFSGVTSNGTQYAFYRHKFVTYKHWGELSGGKWSVRAYDFGPDDQLTEGTEPSPPDDPGEDHSTSFSFPLAVPPNPLRSEKTIESYRIRVFGTQTGLPVFTGCNPFETNCPGDLNGDGIIDTVDLQLFFEWYLAADLRADLTLDGVLAFDDIIAYRAIWIPGFCNRTGTGFGAPGGRPINPPSGSVDEPIVRPI